MRWGRIYFAAQAVAGAVWWVSVFTVPLVRELTLGTLDPVAVAAFDIPLFVGGSAVAAFGVRVAAVIATAWTGFVAAALAAWATVTGEAGWGVLLMAAALGGSVIALCLVTLGRVPTGWVASGPFRFRLADAQAAAATHVRRTAAQIVVFWGLALGVVPAVIAFFEQRWGLHVDLGSGIRVAGVALFLLASSLGLWAAAVMSTRGGGTPLPSAMANHLVIAGPYRLVRNPMAVAGIVQGVAVGLMLSSWLVVVWAVTGSLVWNYVIRPLEEADLEERFADEFRRYRETVRCWLPGRSRMPRSVGRA